MGPCLALSGRRAAAIAMAGPAARSSALVSPGGDAGVTPRGFPVRLCSSGKRLLEAASRFHTGGFCAGALPDAVGNKAASKVSISGGQASWLVDGAHCGWVQTCCRLLAGHGPGARPAWRVPQSSLHFYCCCFYYLGLVPRSGFEHGDVCSLRTGQSSFQPSAALPA